MAYKQQRCYSGCVLVPRHMVMIFVQHLLMIIMINKLYRLPATLALFLEARAATKFAAEYVLGKHMQYHEPDIVLLLILIS